VAVLIGSLRKASINRMVANALIELETQYCLGQLSIYNQDVDENAPPQWIQFRGRIKAAAAVLFVTPEYNRSMPAALKNALDGGSRPYGMNAWSGKPGAVASASPRAGGFGASRRPHGRHGGHQRRRKVRCHHCFR
jgi:chromate reductase